MLLPVAALVLPIIALSGCSSQSGLADLATGSTSAQTIMSAPQSVMSIVAKVALSPLTGPPQTVADELVRKLDVAATTSKLALLSDVDAVGDYRLKGYLVATKNAKGAELSYIWDVFNNRGKRIDRASGSETVVGVISGTDIWSIVPQQIYQKIANQGIAAVVRRIPARPAIIPSALAPKVSLQ